MTKIQQPRFDKNEFGLLCEAIANFLPDFKIAGWTKYLISVIEERSESYGLIAKWKVDQTQFMRKLESLTQSEFHELITEINLFWNNDDETERAKFSALEPIQKIFYATKARGLDLGYILGGEDRTL